MNDCDLLFYKTIIELRKAKDNLIASCSLLKEVLEELGLDGEEISMIIERLKRGLV